MVAAPSPRLPSRLSRPASGFVPHVGGPLDLRWKAPASALSRWRECLGPQQCHGRSLRVLQSSVPSQSVALWEVRYLPPVDSSTRRTAELPRSSALPMPRIDSPALYMRQSSAHWESVNNRRRPPLMHHPLFVRLQPGCFADRLRPPTLSGRTDCRMVQAPESPDRSSPNHNP